MGEALMSRYGGGSSSSDEKIIAQVNVTTAAHATITCAGCGTVLQRTPADGTSTFWLEAGDWVISSTASGSRNITITAAEVIDVNLTQVTYGISIDMSNTDPESAVTYIDDAVGLNPLSVNLETGECNYGDWEEIITGGWGVKPCLYKDGARSVYLNPNDYSKTVAGADADITSGAAGDVMVEFKKTWYKYSKSGNILTFQVANYDRSADGFVTSAFKTMDGSDGVAGTVRDYMYFGAYEAYGDAENNKARSLSGKSVSNGENYWSYQTYRANCKAMGVKYGMEDWCKRYYILGLLMLVTKTRECQAAVGYGNINVGTGTSGLINAGTMDTKGLFFGGKNKGTGVKCFGIENMWGNTYSWCDGIQIESETSILIKDCPPYKDAYDGEDTSSYTSVGHSLPVWETLYPTEMSPVLGGAAIFASVGQSDSTIGWPDYLYVIGDSGYVAVVGGGYWDNLAIAGPFCAGIDYDPGSDYDDCVGRLVAA